MSDSRRPTKKQKLSNETIGSADASLDPAQIEREKQQNARLAKAAPYARVDLQQDITKTLLKKNKKLQSHLSTIAQSHKASALSSFEHDAFLLPSDNGGLIQVENDLERTWKVSQKDIKRDVGVGAASKGFDLNLEHFGPYSVDYTPNGRCAFYLPFHSQDRFASNH